MTMNILYTTTIHVYDIFLIVIIITIVGSCALYALKN